jgi:hypothetical protein
MMVWIVVSVVGVVLSVGGMLCVVAPGVRQFCWGAVCGLGVAGGLLLWWQLSTTLEPTRASHAGAPGKETAVSWVPRASRPGPPGVTTALAPPEAVSTPAEAAQAVQRFRAAHDVQQAAEESPAVVGPPAPVRPPAETLAPPLATPGPPPLALPPPPAPPLGSALKSCEALKAEIQAKLAAKGLTGYVLTITTSGDVPGPEIVGSCEGNTRKIVLYRARNAL